MHDLHQLPKKGWIGGHQDHDLLPHVSNLGNTNQQWTSPHILGISIFISNDKNIVVKFY